MGLGGIKTAWQHKQRIFAHTKGDKYTSLVFDNRGMGESDKPCQNIPPLKCKDTIELLDHVGWTGKGNCTSLELAWVVDCTRDVRHMS